MLLGHLSHVFDYNVMNDEMAYFLYSFYYTQYMKCVLKVEGDPKIGDHISSK